MKTCYSINRRLESPVQLYVSSYNKDYFDRFDKSHSNWDLNLKTESIFELFDANQIVYLSPDSENLLDEIDDTKVYVIGGIVDLNIKKVF